MCSIAGIIEDKGQIEVRNPEIYKQMMETMQRRGPDESAIFEDGQAVLLHTRLSVVDLDHGKQPMCCKADHTYTIVYNGELYNTEELRTQLKAEGQEFEEYSDTEVILKAYIVWKEDCVEKLNGIFAFAIWDKEARSLFMARDRMGVKPFFFAEKKGTFLFASELKTLLIHPMVDATIDLDGIAQIMLLGPGRKPGSGVFCDIQELKPGEYGTYQKHRGVWLTTYHQLKDHVHHDNLQQTIAKVKYLVEDAICRQLHADVEVATFLSGGLDSSIITAIAAKEFAKQGRQLKTFSVDYEDNEKYFHSTHFQPAADHVYIDIMKDSVKSDHHTIVLQTAQLIDALYAAVDARDLPGMADIDSSLLLFCKEIRQHATVALSGECADEIFGGYPWYRDPSIRLQDGFPWAQSTQYRYSFLRSEIREKIDGEAYVDTLYRETLKECDILTTNSSQEKRLREMVNLNMKWFMQTLLDRKDRMSMYQSLEVRVPFCDMRLAQYMYTVPWEWKDLHGFEKGLLREAMKDLLPKEVLWRKKSPYPKTWHPQYRILVNRLLEEVIQCDGPLLQIVDRGMLQKLLVEEKDIPWYGQLMNTPQTIAYFLQINYWMKKYDVKIRLESIQS